MIIVYANINSNTSFINELLLLKDNLYKCLDIISFVVVQNIVNKRIVNKQMHLSIYIIDVNEVILKARLYVIKDIKVVIILVNNILKVS